MHHGMEKLDKKEIAAN